MIADGLFILGHAALWLQNSVWLWTSQPIQRQAGQRARMEWRAWHGQLKNHFPSARLSTKNKVSQTPPPTCLVPYRSELHHTATPGYSCGSNIHPLVLNVASFKNTLRKEWRELQLCVLLVSFIELSYRLSLVCLFTYSVCP